MKLSLIAAVGRNGVIGHGNALAWTDALDLKRFRAATLGCPVIMGRKTWDSLPPRFKPLPGRRNVVVTGNAALAPTLTAAGAEAAPSLPAALQRLADAPQVFVIGGAQLYAQALPLADELLLTEVDADLIGDVHFPAFDRSAYLASAAERHVSAAGLPFAFITYRKPTPTA